MKKIGTHNGIFHADEVFACAIILEQFPDAEIVRTRDQAILDCCDFVVDVGGVCDPANGRFDHHQKGFAFGRGNGIKFSSAGLVWDHFYINNPDRSHRDLEIAEIVDFRLVVPIDAVDNGQNLFGETSFDGVAPYGISAIISSFNPTWQESDRSENEAFFQALGVAQNVLRREIASAKGTIEARSIVLAAISNPETCVGGGQVLVLDRFIPWREVVAEISSILYVVFPDPNGQWMIQCAPASLNSFASRKLLPESWAGLRNEQFADASGVQDGIFCHVGRFICGAKSKASAIFLALKAT
jgi:uncharacterized UPF0160 family protein